MKSKNKAYMERSQVNGTAYPINVLMESISAQMSLQRNAYTRTFKLLPLHHHPDMIIWFTLHIGTCMSCPERVKHVTVLEFDLY